ncbi:hypothetical protein CHUV0807_2133 [Cardiobacterium hominis]|uniref:Uncharacterized protein n=1 Tax=Cardiobacterium hominis TaxID=2718 RepID=A0A1C3H6B4_9GAMM|nr:hypothetical protein CHUV0807_2133 [Cardiobacterium hominis]
MGSFASLQVVSGIIHTPERFRGRCIWLVDSRYNHPGVFQHTDPVLPQKKEAAFAGCLEYPNRHKLQNHTKPRF